MKILKKKKQDLGTSLVVQGLSSMLLRPWKHGAQVRSLVREPGSHMLHVLAKKRPRRSLPIHDGSWFLRAADGGG